MSKLITTRYEFVTYDDAAGVLAPANQLPPTYPLVLDQYTVNTVASAGNSYGSQIISNVTQATLNVPPGANITIISAPTNPNPLYVRSANAVVVAPGTVPVQAPYFYLAPGQTITYPGVFVTVNTPPNVIPCDTGLGMLNNPAPFTITVLWSL